MQFHFTDELIKSIFQQAEKMSGLWEIFSNVVVDYGYV
jgi:hypothetical protein